MPSEHQRSVPKNTASRPAAQQVNNVAKALPAVKPFQQKAAPETATAMDPLSSYGSEARPPLQAKKPVVTGTPVVQMVLHTKEGIFLNQLKRQIIAAIYTIYANQDGKSKKGDWSEHIAYAEALNRVNLINTDTLIYDSRNDGAKGGKIKSQKSQTAFFDEQKDDGLKMITLDGLRDNDVLVDGLSLAEGGASWDEFRPPLKGLPGIGTRIEGLGGQTKGNVVPAKTRIQWDSVNTNSGEGKKATALVLGPDHPLGSTPASSKVDKTAILGNKSGKAYIRGHLLNDHLGGPGTDVRNIAAIPKDVNTEQSDKVEEKVKDRVNNKHEIVFYQVEATYSQDVNMGEWYASELKSSFGTYKEGTQFNALNFGGIPHGDLADFHEHTLPIKSPTDYKTIAGDRYTGYSTSGNNYTLNGKSRDPQEITARTGNVAIFNVDRERDILLKDSKQVKLEFISFAIYSIPIAKLKRKVETLKEENEWRDQLLRGGVEELNRLETDLEYRNSLLQEGSSEITRLEKDVAFRDRLLFQGVSEISRLEGELSKQNDFVQQLQEKIILLNAEIRDEDDVDISPIDRSELINRVSEILGDAHLQKKQLIDANRELSRLRKELEQVKQQLEEANKKLEEVTRERDRYQRSSRHNAKGSGFKSGFLGQDKSYDGEEPLSPISKHLWDEEYDIGQEHYEETNRLKSRNEYFTGQTDAIERLGEVIELGRIQGYEDGRLPKDVPAAIIRRFGQLDPFIYSSGYIDGYTKGLSSLAASYESGFREGVQQYKNEQLRELQWQPPITNTNSFPQQGFPQQGFPQQGFPQHYGNFPSYPIFPSGYSQPQIGYNPFQPPIREPEPLPRDHRPHPSQWRDPNPHRERPEQPERRIPERPLDWDGRPPRRNNNGPSSSGYNDRHEKRRDNDRYEKRRDDDRHEKRRDNDRYEKRRNDDYDRDNNSGRRGDNDRRGRPNDRPFNSRGGGDNRRRRSSRERNLSRSPEPRSREERREDERRTNHRQDGSPSRRVNKRERSPSFRESGRKGRDIKSQWKKYQDDTQPRLPRDPHDKEHL